ncbi:GLPGLI family protein [Lutibacter oricola]|uniref:GLPGLI family protein n=1 Tax=Lutibacter oricola TaxID=762486 RepID=A0A1H2TBD0_9FLAO|nr:GLPGLI family protein [Lutibacter oricola]SDW41253.1 GLPGLI family protein [Lutibacter oricola]
MFTRVFKFSLFLISLLTFSVSAQNFQGIATYQTKTTLDIDFEKSGIPADRIKHMKQMMKSRLEKTYKLTFNKSESIYKEEKKLDNATGGRGMRFMMFGGGASGKHYKNIQTKKSSKENEFSGKNFLIKNDLTKYDWKMQQETKTIGNYMCFQATATVKMPAPREMKFGRGRPGEKKSDEKRKKEEDKMFNPDMVDTIVTAWYTLDIPVGHGPGEYYGLPGLILELSYANTNILCTKIVINPKDKIELKEPKKGKVVTQKEYDKIVLEKTQEMRERMRNEREKGGNHGGRMRFGG